MYRNDFRVLTGKNVFLCPGKHIPNDLYIVRLGYEEDVAGIYFQPIPPILLLFFISELVEICFWKEPRVSSAIAIDLNPGKASTILKTRSTNFVVVS
jgi:hypothetical protein